MKIKEIEIGKLEGKTQRRIEIEPDPRTEYVIVALERSKFGGTRSLRIFTDTETQESAHKYATALFGVAGKLQQHAADCIGEALGKADNLARILWKERCDHKAKGKRRDQ